MYHELRVCGHPRVLYLSSFRVSSRYHAAAVGELRVLLLTDIQPTTILVEFLSQATPSGRMPCEGLCDSRRAFGVVR